MTGRRDKAAEDDRSHGQSLAEQNGAAQPGLLLHPSMPNYAQLHFNQNQALQGELKEFWQQAMQEVHAAGTDPTEFKTQQLPLARIKKIMKSDEDVRMISAEAPVLFAKACEFFIHEMTMRAWNVAQEHQRRTLQRSDIAVAIARTHIWDFLLDTVPLQEAIDATNAEAGEDEGGAVAGGSAVAAPPATAAGGAAAGPAAAGNPAAVPAQMQAAMGMFAPNPYMPHMANPYNPMMPPGMVYPPGMPPPGMTFPGMPPQFAAPPGQDPASNATSGGAAKS